MNNGVKKFKGKKDGKNKHDPNAEGDSLTDDGDNTPEFVKLNASKESLSSDEGSIESISNISFEVLEDASPVVEPPTNISKNESVDGVAPSNSQASYLSLSSFCDFQTSTPGNSVDTITTINDDNCKSPATQSLPTESPIGRITQSYAETSKGNSSSMPSKSFDDPKKSLFNLQTNTLKYEKDNYKETDNRSGQTACSKNSPSNLKNPKEQTQLCVKKSTKKEYNILILGGCGTGKSTTINAYANYEKYATIEEAERNKFVELISSSFKLAHPETGEEICIKSGTDDNESNIPNQSRTQEPMAYRFMFADKMIRLIDTPGMGDTRGLMADKENFEKIIEYLKNYKTLHGIVIMMKSNETRNVTAFNYCFTELFSRLHRSASENIFFCFTFSRTTFFRAGDGLYMLNKMLKEEFPNADLTLKPKLNCFFIDNEAYRYLVAKKAGYPFFEDQKATFTEAWNKSADQTRQMFRCITEKSPHNLEHTFLLNKIQNFIVELAEPIVQLQKEISVNGKTIERQKQNSRPLNIVELHSPLKTSGPVRELGRLEESNTVCTSNKCKEIENTTSELNKEMEHIQKSAVSLGYLLHKHSNSSVYKFIEPYLQLIGKEKMKVELIPGYSGETLRMLNNSKAAHVKEIENVISKGSSLELWHSYKIINDLCELKYSGEQFKKVVNQSLKDKTKKVVHEEKVALNLSEDQ